MTEEIKKFLEKYGESKELHEWIYANRNHLENADLERMEYLYSSHLELKARYMERARNCELSVPPDTEFSVRFKRLN
jgi:hypothetical protein